MAVLHLSVPTAMAPTNQNPAPPGCGSTSSLTVWTVACWLVNPGTSHFWKKNWTSWVCAPSNQLWRVFWIQELVSKVHNSDSKNVRTSERQELPTVCGQFGIFWQPFRVQPCCSIMSHIPELDLHSLPTWRVMLGFAVLNLLPNGIALCLRNGYKPLQCKQNKDCGPWLLGRFL